MPRSRTTQSGQALVESAITLPLTVFLVLGSIQLFTAMQARAMAQYAAFRATRAGSLNSGDCTAMEHAAVASLLPTFTRTDSADALANAFHDRCAQAGKSVPPGGAPGVPAENWDCKFNPAADEGRNETILWLDRVAPLQKDIPADEEEHFDVSTIGPSPNPAANLQVRLIFWYPLRLPFVNWVISEMAASYWRMSVVLKDNPLMPVQRDPNWKGPGLSQALKDTYDGRTIADEFKKRLNRKHYVLPIQVNYSMRMMTPARRMNFVNEICRPFP